jgi:glycosyltransferase involved in cell wall biosynthesis
MNEKTLFILHFPPPIHGSSIVGQTITESEVINQSFDCRYVNLGTSTSIDEIGKGGIRKIFRFLFILGKVLQQLIVFRPQLGYIAITAKGVAFYKDSVVVMLFKLFRVKLVYHLHNKGVSTRQEKWFDNLLYRFVFKNANVILLSKYLYPDIQKYVPETRVYYCPNGIPENQVESGKWKVESSEPLEILFLSNLIESKGVFVLLEACKILQNKKINFHCTFVGGIGDVSEQQFKSKVVELELTGNIHYAGKKYGKEKEEAFVHADIFVHPSYNDCFPLVLLEAMQYSLPVVSTYEGGIPDVVEDGVTGFLVPQKDVQALADKLEILIKNPELRKQMGAAGRKKYEEEFTLERFEGRMVEILKSVVND